MTEDFCLAVAPDSRIATCRLFFGVLPLLPSLPLSFLLYIFLCVLSVVSFPFPFHLSLLLSLPICMCCLWLLVSFFVPSFFVFNTKTFTKKRSAALSFQ